MNSSANQPEAIFTPDLTVATVVARDGRLLMIEERVQGQAVFNQPAGHLEAGETLQQAAIRETLEESGWDVELIDFIGWYQWTSPDDGRSRTERRRGGKGVVRTGSMRWVQCHR